MAGNITTSEIIASLEYGAAMLGVKVILVMGHGSCGAVEAAIQSKEVPGQISALFPHIQPAIDEAGPDVDATAKANAKLQANLLRKVSTAISGLLKEESYWFCPRFITLPLVRSPFWSTTRTRVAKHLSTGRYLGIGCLRLVSVK